MNGRALGGDRAMGTPAQHSECLSSQVYREILQLQGRPELRVDGLSSPCLEKGAEEVGEAQVRLRCLCMSPEHELSTALPLVLG